MLFAKLWAMPNEEKEEYTREKNRGEFAQCNEEKEDGEEEACKGKFEAIKIKQCKCINKSSTIH